MPPCRKCPSSRSCWPISRRSCNRVRLAAAALVLFSFGCRGSNSPAVRQVATYPFENLTGNPDLDWLSPVVVEGLRQAVEGSQTVHIAVRRSAADAQLTRPSHLLRGYYTIEQGSLVVRAVVSQAANSAETGRYEARGPVGGSPEPLVEALARQIAGEAIRPFAIPGVEAARLYGAALQEQDPAKVAALLDRVLKLAPDFGGAYLLQAQTQAALGDRAACLATLRAGLERKTSEIARARMQALLSVLDGTLTERIAATEKLASLTPADPEPPLQLAQYYMGQSRIADAATQYRKALAVQPETPEVWNQAAYAEVLSGDVEGALTSIARYADLSPGNPNPQDSRGEILFQAGRFPEAVEAFLDSYQMNPGFLASATMRKAAMARLLSGDTAGAGSLFSKYLDAAAQDPLLDLRKAQWNYTLGKHSEAIAALRNFAERPEAAGDRASLALSQAAAWLIDSGGRPAAAQVAVQAAAQAGSPAVAAQAAISRFVSQAEAGASEWAARAERDFPAESPTKQYALAYALLYGKHYREAALVLQQMYRQTNPLTAGHLKELLALAYAGQGQWDQARPLLEVWPIPDPGGDATFHCLVFPEGIRLRAELAARDNDRAESDRLMKLYRTLAPQAENR